MYAITSGLWPVYVPCILEETFIITLLIQKMLYDHYERLEKRKNKRSKLIFMKTLSSSIGDMGDRVFNLDMTSEELIEEFKKIDSSLVADGKISKQELKEFLNIGKVSILCLCSSLNELT